MVFLRLYLGSLRILLEISFAYLFVIPETWLPAPKAAEEKVVCKRKTEICSVKKMRRAGECWPVKPEGSIMAGGRFCLLV